MANMNCTVSRRLIRALLSQLTFVTVAVALFAQSATTLAADCVTPKASASNGATFRDAPVSSATGLGQLPAGKTAPFIAAIPRWYETRTPSGQAAYVSKQSSQIVQCAALPGPAAAGANSFELHAIDVGTGLSVFVRGHDFTLLYDAGSNDDRARGDDNRVVAYLRSLTPPVTRIDHLLLSHPHQDHVELMPDVLARFDVQNVWNSGAYNDICGYRNFLKAVAVEPGIRYHTVTQDAGTETVELGEKKCYGTDEPKHTITVPHQSRIDDSTQSLGQAASMRILHADGSKRSSFNENSLVVRLDLGPNRVLLMGDAEAGGRKAPTTAPTAGSIEGKLLACCSNELKADILIAGHHGSKTSSRVAFLDAVGAKFYVISSGPTKYSTVTLPDDEVVSQFEARGQVFRTDLEDDQCLLSPDKIGRDADGKAGGCDNVFMTLPANGQIVADYRRVAD